MASSINASTTAGVVTTADTSGVLNIQTAGTTAIAIDASQAVAVGSGTGTKSLTITSTDTAAYLQTTGANTVNARLQSNATTASVGTTSNHALNIQTNATTVGTFNTSGNLGIGTASPNSRLTTSGTTGTANGLTIIDTDYSNDTHQIYGNNSLHLSAGTGGAGAILFRTAGTERARFNSTGALVLAGGTTTANGIGITFPATQSASTNANTLDDYEEGTFTPTVTATSGSNGGGTFTGSYIKIGRFVYVTLGAVSVSKSTLSGTIVVGGLPFEVNAINATATCRWELGSGGVPAAGTTILCPQSGGSTTFEIQQFGNSGYLGLLAAGNLGSTFSFYNITYSYITLN